MNDALSQSVVDKLTKICSCRGISRAAIKKAIQNGCDSAAAVERKTGAGSGACRGHNCRPKIERLLAEAKDAPQ